MPLSAFASGSDGHFARAIFHRQNRPGLQDHQGDLCGRRGRGHVPSDFRREENKEVFLVSITQLTFDRRLPVAREIAAYQKHHIEYSPPQAHDRRACRLSLRRKWTSSAIVPWRLANIAAAQHYERTCGVSGRTQARRRRLRPGQLAPVVFTKSNSELGRSAGEHPTRPDGGPHSAKLDEAGAEVRCKSPLRAASDPRQKSRSPRCWPIMRLGVDGFVLSVFMV